MTKAIQDMQMEFAKGLLKLQPVLLSPFKSRDKKREALCGFVKSLSEDTFTQFIPQIVEMINMKKDVCKEYADSEAQVVGILKWLPRMKEFKDLLREFVKLNRQKHGFKN